MSDEGRQEVVASDVYARRLGINGVPCFIVNRKYAVSGRPAPLGLRRGFQPGERDAANQRRPIDRLSVICQSSYDMMIDIKCLRVPPRKARTRAEIFEHAARLFRAARLRGTNIDDIMLAAGLTRGAFYAHFRSKDDRCSPM
jgi:hypothetical protein